MRSNKWVLIVSLAIMTFLSLMLLGSRSHAQSNGYDFVFSIAQGTSFYADLSTGQVQTITALATVWGYSTSPNGQYMVGLRASDKRLCVFSKAWVEVACLPEDFMTRQRLIVWTDDSQSLWIYGQESQSTDVLLQIRTTDGAVLTRIDHTQAYASEGNFQPNYRDLSLSANIAVSTSGPYIYLLDMGAQTIAKVIFIGDLIPKGTVNFLMFSPDREKLAMFIDCRAIECQWQDRLALYDVAADSFEIYDLVIDGTKYSRISNLFWSPNGMIIAFHALGDATTGTTDVFATILFDMNTHAFRIFSRDEYDIGVLQWSPSGDQLAKTSCYVNGACKVSIFDLDGTEHELGTFTPNWDYIGGSWVPDDWLQPNP